MRLDALEFPFLSMQIRRLLREVFETIILALLVFMALHVSIQNYRVEGASMDPTLQDGQYVIVNKVEFFRFGAATLPDAIPFLGGGEDASGFLFDPPERGDVVVFHAPPHPGRDYVKRVIGVPGDTVEIVQGQVYLNGSVLVESYLTGRDGASMSPVSVEPGNVFVLGDNRASSNDSRDWGVVPYENLVGTAWVRFWPFGHMSFLSAPLQTLSR